MPVGDRLWLALARGQIALGAVALRAGLDVGMVTLSLMGNLRRFSD